MGDANTVTNVRKIGKRISKVGRKRRPGVIGGVARALLAGEIPEDARLEIDSLLAELERQCGPGGPSAAQRVSLYAIQGLLVAIWRSTARVQRGGRGSRSAMAALVSFNNCLRRQLQSLGLQSKPKPLSLADILPRKFAEMGGSSPEKARFGTETSEVKP